MFKTRITELFGIKYPVVQGGMVWVSRAELASAVSNAGGLGIIAALTFSSPRELVAEIRKTKSLTDKPFGVNMTLLPTLQPVDIERYLDAILEEGVKIIETSGRSPEPYMEHFKNEGVKVIHKCTAVRFARTAQRRGCDVVSIDGFECAGRPGEEDITSLILIPLTVDAIDIPVLASGGFGDGRGLVAALALGAEGINLGTRFMATQESPVHKKIKELLIQVSERDTMLVQRSLRNTARVINNSDARKVFEMEGGASLEELSEFISGQRRNQAFKVGDIDRGLIPCGQVVGIIRGIPTAGEVIESIVRDVHEILLRLNRKLYKRDSGS
jgi:NAD(P)H-dependent flavin oxidoreductase YrpB (nitropropane dioxygenase family)